MVQNLGERLKIARIRKGLSQEQVANIVGKKVGTISSYETGNVTPSVEILMKLAAAYSVSTDYLLGIEKEKALFVDGLGNEHIDLLEKIATEFKKIND